MEIIGTAAAVPSLFGCIKRLKEFVDDFRNAHKQLDEYRNVLESIETVRPPLSSWHELKLSSA
jgi:hypothetical protein